MGSVHGQRWYHWPQHFKKTFKMNGAPVLRSNLTRAKVKLHPLTGHSNSRIVSLHEVH